jgi:hypothetical protein
MDASIPSEISITTLQSTGRHVTQNSTLLEHLCDKLKSEMNKFAGITS